MSPRALAPAHISEHPASAPPHTADASFTAAQSYAASTSAFARTGDLLRGHAPIEVSASIAARGVHDRPSGHPSRATGPTWVGTRKVAIVSPCFNRTADAEALVDDLLKLDRRQVDVRMVLVDNNSDVPLSKMRVGLGENETDAPWFALEHLRQNFNAGGSGGYNAGLRRALEYALPPAQSDAAGRPGEGWVADYVWMVDSDVRLAPDTLYHLLNEMERDKGVVAAGSTIADPLTGQGFELGGHINRKTGIWEPHVFGAVGVREVFETDYLAACCALIRTDAIRRTGVMPDTFLHGDDVEWMRRMRDMSGGKNVCVPWAVAMHPQFSRFSTWTRYYTGRSAFGTLSAVDRGVWVRLKRAHIEVRRAVQQALNDRADLARLHVRALQDAAKGIVTGKAADGVINVLPAKPFKVLATELEKVLTEAGYATPESRANLRVRVLPSLLLTYKEESQIFAALESLGVRHRDRWLRYRRSFVGELWDYFLRLFCVTKRPDIAIAPARGQAFCWLSAPIVLQVWTNSFVIRRPARVRSVATAARVGVDATFAWLRASLRTPGASLMYPGRLARPIVAYAASREIVDDVNMAAAARSLRVHVVIAAHTRPAALRRTLESLLGGPLFATETGSRVTVVDNGQGAGVAGLDDLLHAHADRLRVIQPGSNTGVAAFNIGVREAMSEEDTQADCLLILDDDAWVEPSHLAQALDLLRERPDLAGVTFNPCHPDTGLSEWGFADALHNQPTDRWPVMGCANLIRASVWTRLGGYEPQFFLYRNDTDLALRLLDSREAAQGAGGGKLHFNPHWVAWHDTLAAGTPRVKKSPLWHRLATRNWVWMCRRNAPLGLSIKGSAMGWAWAHRLAGLSVSRQWSTLAGGLAGVCKRSPRVMNEAPRTLGLGLRRLLELRRAHQSLRKQRRRLER